ncbi:MAG: undecaprenyl-diphosphate phosphatase, partial [Eubacteriales bacterium]|nr:undecaprenyl-diphosphate phosphatase [Eubacteriales bacterium]
GHRKALLIGCAQCMSLIPGMSRSASTIMGGMIAGLTVKAAAEFSFFLAIPTMIAATGYTLVKGISSITQAEIFSLVTGFAVSFAVAFLVVGSFLRFLASHRLRGFAYYRLGAGAVMLALVILRII